MPQTRELGELSGQLFGCVFLPQGLHVQVALALGEFAPVRRDEQRRVRVFRGLAVERFHQPDLPRRGVKQVARAHNARDAHIEIVHAHGELVGEHAVRAPDEKIVAPVPQFGCLQTVVRVNEGNVRIRDRKLFRRAATHAQALLHLQL